VTEEDAFESIALDEEEKDDENDGDEEEEEAVAGEEHGEAEGGRLCNAIDETSTLVCGDDTHSSTSFFVARLYSCCDCGLSIRVDVRMELTCTFVR
jgi:hypothetical protein